MTHPFTDLTLDFIEDAINEYTGGRWEAIRYTDYIKIKRQSTGQVVLVTAFLHHNEDDEKEILKIVRAELEKGVPE